MKKNQHGNATLNLMTAVVGLAAAIIGLMQILHSQGLISGSRSPIDYIEDALPGGD